MSFYESRALARRVIAMLANAEERVGDFYVFAIDDDPNATEFSFETFDGGFALSIKADSITKEVKQVSLFLDVGDFYYVEADCEDQMLRFSKNSFDPMVVRNPVLQRKLLEPIQEALQHILLNLHSCSSSRWCKARL